MMMTFGLSRRGDFMESQASKSQKIFSEFSTHQIIKFSIVLCQTGVNYMLMANF